MIYFLSYTGLSVNKENSMLCGNNIQSLQLIKDSLGIQLANVPFKYLGLLLVSSSPQLYYFNDLFQQNCELVGWLEEQIFLS